MQGDEHTFFSDPEKLGIIAYLTAGITLFLRGTVMLTSTHEKQMARLYLEIEQHKKNEEKWQNASFDLLRTGRQLAQTTTELVHERNP